MLLRMCRGGDGDRQGRCQPMAGCATGTKSLRRWICMFLCCHHTVFEHAELVSALHADNVWALQSWCRKRFEGNEGSIDAFFKEARIHNDGQWQAIVCKAHGSAALKAVTCRLSTCRA